MLTPGSLSHKQKVTGLPPTDVDGVRILICLGTPAFVWEASMPLCVRIKDGVGVGGCGGLEVNFWPSWQSFAQESGEDPCCAVWREWRGSVLCEPSVMPMNRLRKEVISSVQFSSVQFSSRSCWWSWSLLCSAVLRSRADLLRSKLKQIRKNEFKKKKKKKGIKDSICVIGKVHKYVVYPLSSKFPQLYL